MVKFGKRFTGLNDKRDYFDFPIFNFPYLIRILVIFQNSLFMVFFVSQLIRYAFVRNMRIF